MLAVVMVLLLVVRVIDVVVGPDGDDGGRADGDGSRWI